MFISKIVFFNVVSSSFQKIVIIERSTLKFIDDKNNSRQLQQQLKPRISFWIFIFLSNPQIRTKPKIGKINTIDMTYLQLDLFGDLP